MSYTKIVHRSFPHPILLIKYKFLVFLFGFFFLLIGTDSTIAANTIRMSSTTSTQNSGLLDSILPQFETKTGIKVHVIAVGTGAALQLGKRGDVDLVFVHAKPDELKMVSEGWFVNRFDVMYNHFVLIGPDADPIQLQQVKSATNALKRIFESQFLFVSRGDNSGTHKKEKQLWSTTGYAPQPSQWYLEVGQGMGKTIRIAAQKRAYTLTDKGTFLSLIDKQSLGLTIVLEGDPPLFNQYGVMAVNPEKHAHIKYKEAMLFINWLVSKAGQNAIGSFRDSKSNQLFFPNATQVASN